MSIQIRLRGFFNAAQLHGSAKKTSGLLRYARSRWMQKKEQWFCLICS
jgi:hypothetical protein